MTSRILPESCLLAVLLITTTGAASAQKEGASPGPPAPFTEGRLTLEITSGSRTETHLYQRRGDRLRISRPGDLIPTPPRNTVNLETGRVTILFPHNGTARTIETAGEKPLAAPASPGFPAMPELPPGIGPGAPGAPAPAGPARPTPEEDPARIGPDLSQLPAPPDGESPDPPETPVPGDVPATPELPAQAVPTPGSVPGTPQIPGVPATPAMPQMPAMPPMPRRLGAAVEPFVLKATGEIKTLHGYPCTRHTLDLPREGRLSLWLTPDEPLFPFHRLRTQGPEARRAEWPDQLAALLRSKDLFPLLVTLHEPPRAARPDETEPAEPGPERVRWEVTSIENTALKDPDETLFSTPESFHRLRD